MQSLKKRLRIKTLKFNYKSRKKVYIKCIELGLPKVDSNYLVKDFIYIVKLIILSWSKY